MNYRRLLSLRLRRHRLPLIVLLTIFGIYFVILFSQMLQVRPTGLWAGHVHVWGDWSLHITMANIFAQKPPAEWFAYHPYYAGGKLTYAFLTNLISGMLMRLGLSLPVAFLLPSMIYGIVLTIGLYAVFYQLLRSQKAAVASVVVFFCSSGLGFLRFLNDWLVNPTWEHLLFPLKDYSRLEVPYQWLAGNWFNGMLVPQRAFLLGMMMTVWIMAVLLWVFPRLLKSSRTTLTPAQRRLLVVAGLIAGLLPIAHMHSFIALVISCALMGLITIKLWRPWLWFAVPAGLLSTALYWQFVQGGIQNPNFMKIMIGWTAPTGANSWEHLQNWVLMWWQIWGVMLPVAAVGLWLYWPVATRLQRAFVLSGFAIFGLANIVLFQPIMWDNSKLFLWSYFFLSPVAVVFLQQLWRQRQSLASRGLAVIFAILLTGTGVMEMWRLLRFDKNSYIMSSTEDIEVGRQLQQRTGSQEIFLTYPSHNHPVMMWGVCPILLGYPGWAYNFGFLYQQRETDIGRILAGGNTAEQLIDQYQISYVVFGPGERSIKGANETYYREKYPPVVRTLNYAIYTVRPAAPN